MNRAALLLAATALLALTACAQEATPAAIPPPGPAGAPMGAAPVGAAPIGGPSSQPGAMMPGAMGAMPAGAAAPAAMPAAAMPMGHAMGQAGAASQPAGTQPAGSATAEGFGTMPGQGQGGQAAGGTMTATVLEAQDVAQYTYLKVKMADGKDQWAAVNKYPGLKAGDKVVISQSVTMTDFHSPSLNKTFDSIVFGMVTSKQ